jgi:hypothetical protein
LGKNDFSPYFFLEKKVRQKFKAKRFLPALEKLLKSMAKQASLFA